MNPVKENPNAVVGGTSGAGGGAALIYLLGLLGVTVSSYGAIIIGGAITTAALYIGRHGVRGLAGTLWRGNH